MPRIRTCPDRAAMTPEMARRRLLFPAPLGPRIAAHSPLPTSSETPLTARIFP